MSFGRKHVTRQDHKKPRRVSNPRGDRRAFSATAQNTQAANSPAGRSMRGGIRL